MSQVKPDCYPPANPATATSAANGASASSAVPAHPAETNINCLEDEDGEKEQQMQQMQQMQVKCIMIDGENAIISADQFDWLCAQAEKVKNLEKVAEAASAEFNAEIARLTDALRMAADEPNIDKARKIADAALTPNAELRGGSAVSSPERHA